MKYSRFVLGLFSLAAFAVMSSIAYCIERAYDLVQVDHRSSLLLDRVRHAKTVALDTSGFVAFQKRVRTHALFIGGQFTEGRSSPA